MNYNEIPANPLLSDFIRCFWKSEVNVDNAEYTILPNGYFDLIAEVRNNTIVKVKITGIWTKAIDVKIEKDVSLYCIRFKPLACEYLFDLKFKSLLNSSAILPLTFWSLDTLNPFKFEDFTAHMSNYAKRKIAASNGIDKRKTRLFELVFSKKNLLVGYITEMAVWEPRQVNRYFNEQYGFSLKVYLNIIRLNAVLDELANNITTSKQGYFDQPHFIREIRKYTGFTPKELFKNKKDRFIQLSSLRF